MANTYELTINYVEAHRQLNGLEKVIHKVHYYYKVTDENNKHATLIRFIDLPEVDATSFVAFDDITIEMVKSWIIPLIDEPSLQVEADNTLQEVIYPSNLILEIKS